MQNNGNKKINDILESNLPPHFIIPTDRNDFRLFMHNKYVNKKYKGVAVEKHINAPSNKRISSTLPPSNNMKRINEQISLTLPPSDNMKCQDELISFMTPSQPIINIMVPSNNELIKADIIKLFNDNPGNYSFGNYNFSTS
jgi:hypothetical protein